MKWLEKQEGENPWNDEVSDDKAIQTTGLRFLVYFPLKWINLICCYYTLPGGVWGGRGKGESSLAALYFTFYFTGVLWD